MRYLTLLALGIGSCTSGSIDEVGPSAYSTSFLQIADKDTSCVIKDAAFDVDSRAGIDGESSVWFVSQGDLMKWPINLGHVGPDARLGTAGDSVAMVEGPECIGNSGCPGFIHYHEPPDAPPALIPFLDPNGSGEPRPENPAGVGDQRWFTGAANRLYSREGGPWSFRTIDGCSQISALVVREGTEGPVLALKCRRNPEVAMVLVLEGSEETYWEPSIDFDYLVYSDDRTLWAVVTNGGGSAVAAMHGCRGESPAASFVGGERGLRGYGWTDDGSPYVVTVDDGCRVSMEVQPSYESELPAEIESSNVRIGDGGMTATAAVSYTTFP